MEHFRVISPNNLRLSNEECMACLTKDDDPMLCIPCLNVTDCDISSELSLVWDLTTLKHPVILGGDGASFSKTGFSYGGTASQLKGDDSIIRKWLEDGFAAMPGRSVARADMYALFCDYCHSSGLLPSNQARFGKTVRNTFPQIKTRRIGVRKHSRYHYTGIGPRDSQSVADKLLQIKKNSVSSVQPVSRDYQLPGNGPPTLTKQNPAACHQLKETLLDPRMEPDHLISTLLPGFPTSHSVKVPKEVKEEMAMLLSLYRYLALDMLTAVIKTQFTKLQEIISVFWRNVPDCVYKYLTCESVMQVVVSCDNQIYGAMFGLLVPNILTQMPKRWANIFNGASSGSKSFAKVNRTLFNYSMVDLLMENFGAKFQHSTERSLQACPNLLKHRKMEELRQFCRRLSHRLSVCRLSGQVREVLCSDSKTGELHSYLSKVKIDHVAAVSTFAFNEKRLEEFRKRIQCGMQQLKQLLKQKADLERYARWIKSMFKQNLDKQSLRKGGNYAGAARVTVMELSYMVAVIARELRATKAPPSVQITFHMLEMFFISYLRHLLELEFGEEKIAETAKPRNNVLLVNP